MPINFSKHVVLITGGTGALGAAVARLLRYCGAKVHVTMSESRGGIRQPFASRVTTHAVDLRDDGAVTALYDELPPLWASIHVAGGFAMSPIEKTRADELRKMLEQNAVTSFLCCREAVRSMRRGTIGGRIVNVAARPAVMPGPGMIAYAASKAAVVSITQSLAEEVKHEGILVNAVLPSLMDTPANRAATPGADHSKWPTVEQVAQAIAFLASPLNALTSGALVPVYGRA